MFVQSPFELDFSRDYERNKISFESFAVELVEDVEEIKGAISGAEVPGFDFEGLCAPVASCTGFTDILA